MGGVGRLAGGVIRVIEGFRQDQVGDWVAELSCLHSQHVRHRPPMRDRPWVLTEAGRRERTGSPIDCPLCDRAELPDGLAVARTAGPFDRDTLPAGLQQDHRVAERTWAVLAVLDGSADFEMATEPPLHRRLGAGDEQPIPPGIAHRVMLDGPVRLEVRFLVSPDRPA
jgi:tellurite resistance-related uncharacterized protein